MSGSISHSIEAQNALLDRTLANGSSRSERALPADASSNAIQARASSDYQVTLSEEAQALQSEEAQQAPTDETDRSESSEATDDNESNTSLTEEEQTKVDDLKARDEEVRTHEQAHAAAGGQYAGSPSYSYEQGPDGQRYVTDGEVQIDVSEIPGDPQATIDKMRQVYRAALAPAEPSGADRSVASEAQQKMSAAMSELAQSNGSQDQTLTNSSETNDVQGTNDASGTANASNTEASTSSVTDNSTQMDVIRRSTLEAGYSIQGFQSNTGGQISINA
ncbi:putative metalloprotease CJM1_0395 family protein [Marinomonas ostreistagni]|uniref:putative metalloprotease CJM1_0395 family protein n=1 Tax=Marinomonas ostreistagni TaxID=359209 RepID=UPI00194DFD86|nr:putative metalloprotease CJM1_0395 family protein [Marinomonas ostreistagni]MBM6550257.1 hypothetical protein [Marinomonas ostreistagni]